MNKLLEQSWKTEKGAQNALVKILEEEETGNFTTKYNLEEETWSLVKTQVPREIERRSAIESPCLYVWDMADKMYKEGAKRSVIINKCIEDGVAYHTARTQYQKWYTACKESGVFDAK